MPTQISNFYDDMNCGGKGNLEYSKPPSSISMIKEVKKEIEAFEKIDFNNYPCLPCLSSIYHLSKIAEHHQRIKIMVPPTILIGFGPDSNDNRLIWNDKISGKLIVKSGYISPKDIS